MFVYQSIPAGTKVTGSTIKLPDGRKITLSEQEEFEFALRLEKEQCKGVIANPFDQFDKPVAKQTFSFEEAQSTAPKAGHVLSVDDLPAPPAPAAGGGGWRNAPLVEPAASVRATQELGTTQTKIRWVRLVFIGIAIPLLLWLLTESAVIVIRWICMGFKKPNS